MIKNYISIKNRLFKEAYTEERRFFDKIVSLWVYSVTRPLSFLLTPFFIILKINANFVTFIGFLFGLFSFRYCFYGSFIEAAIFYNLFLVFDSIDGNIARLTKPTKIGEYYDAVTGDIINFFFIPFIGLGIYLNNVGFILNNEFIINNIFVLSLVVSILQLMFSLNSQRKKNIFKNNNGPVRVGSSEKVSIIEYIIRNSFGFAFNAPVSLLLAFYNALDILIIYNLIIMPFVLIFSIFKK